ncbi:MAG: hypothetical protein L6R41_001735, partial [Letrouitia leprolyta]
MPKDCYTALAQFETYEAKKYGNTPFEFLPFGGSASSPFRKVGTPRRYYFETCTLAIVMLNYFDPKELGLRTGATFSPRDVATFKDLGVAFLRTANECLSKFKNHSIEDRVGFISGMGWSSTGMTASVGAFIWATGSQMDERVRRDLPEGGFSWSYNL